MFGCFIGRVILNGDHRELFSQIEDQKLVNDIVKLEAAVKYREEDLNNAKILIEQFTPNDPETEIDLACIEYKVYISIATNTEFNSAE